ncbi:MAG TPA: I78 family peptidase inhibitor [Sphingomicrobium sp.]
MRKLLLCSPLLLVACATHDQPVPIASVYPGSKCTQSVGLDSFKGQPASVDLAAQIMTAARAHKLRWVPFGAMITMEYSDERVTVRLDQQNRVLSVTCG